MLMLGLLCIIMMAVMVKVNWASLFIANFLLVIGERPCNCVQY
jgi:hypothetical protein